MTSQLQNVQETAKLLGVKPVTIRKWIFERQLPHVKLGRRVFVKLQDIQALIDKNYHPAKDSGRQDDQS